jgi:hypothetical protein
MTRPIFRPLRNPLTRFGWLLVVWCVFAGILVAGAVREGFVQSACLGYGYPQSDVTIKGTAYCIKRVQQSDVVRPLDSLRGHS